MASPFPNDGSFLERFKQLQQDPPLETLKSTNAVSKSSLPSKSLSNVQSSNSSSQKSSLKLSVPNGKLAFSLKQKSKLAVNAIKLGEDDDDDGEAEADRRVKKARTEILPSSVSPEPKESGTCSSWLLLVILFAFLFGAVDVELDPGRLVAMVF